MRRERVVEPQTGAPSVPVFVVGRLWIDDELHRRLMIPIRSRLVFSIEEKRQGRAQRLLMDAAVHLVAQTIRNRQLRRGFPCILKIEVVGLAAHSSFIELGAYGSKFSRRADVVRVGSRGEQAGERVGKRVTG